MRNDISHLVKSASGANNNGPIVPRPLGGLEGLSYDKDMMTMNPNPPVNKIPGPRLKELQESEGITREKPSKRMLRTWVKKVADNSAGTFPVYMNGEWTLNVFRGKKRMISLKLGDKLS